VRENMKRILPFKAFALLIFFTLPFSVFAETKEIIAEGEYIMGDGETMAVAEERAQKEASRHAAEEAGAFVKSYTKVKDMALQEDVIEVIANHSMKITILEKKRTMIGDAVKFYSKIKAVVTTEEIEANLEKIAKDRSVVETYNRLKVEYDRQTKEMEELKKKLIMAKGENKKQLSAKIRDEENLFKANLLIEKGEQSLFYGRYMDAIEAFTSAIALNPNFAYAYALRGGVYLEIGQNDKAYEDANKAIAIEPENPQFYALRAATYSGCSESGWANCEKALNDIEKAIRLKPESYEFYVARAGIYHQANMPDKAIEDFNKATVLGLRDEWPYLLAVAYLKKAQLAKDKNDYHTAIADITSAITILINAKYYHDTLIILSDTLRDLREKKFTEEQAALAAMKALNLDIKNEKHQNKMGMHFENLRLVFALYFTRSEIYRDMGDKGKAVGDLMTACNIYWDEDECKVFRKDTKKPTGKPTKKKR
jgi:tetratricopeptide (TPR) repeat protein